MSLSSTSFVTSGYSPSPKDYVEEESFLSMGLVARSGSAYILCDKFGQSKRKTNSLVFVGVDSMHRLALYVGRVLLMLCMNS